MKRIGCLIFLSLCLLPFFLSAMFSKSSVQATESSWIRARNDIYMHKSNKNKGSTNFANTVVSVLKNINDPSSKKVKMQASVRMPPKCNPLLKL